MGAPICFPGMTRAGIAKESLVKKSSACAILLHTCTAPCPPGASPARFTSFRLPAFLRGNDRIGRARQRTADVLQRSAQKQCAILSGKVLQSADDKHKTLEVGQIKDRERFRQHCDRILSGQQVNPGSAFGRGHGGRGAFNARDSFNRFADDSAPSPDVSPFPGNGAAVKTVPHGQYQRPFRFLSVGGQKQGEAKQVRHRHREYALKVVRCRVAFCRGQPAASDFPKSPSCHWPSSATNGKMAALAIAFLFRFSWWRICLVSTPPEQNLAPRFINSQRAASPSALM